MEFQTLGSRLQALIDKFSSKKMSWFARDTGIARSSLYLYVDGKNTPDAETLAKIAKFTGCDLNWLVMGEGVAPGEKEEGRAGMVAEGLAGYGDARPAPLDVDLLADAVKALEEISEEAGLKLTPAEKAARVALIYELEKGREEKLSPETIRRLAKLG